MTTLQYGQAGTLSRFSHRPWVRGSARAGYAAKGIVYLLTGVLAALSALGKGGQVTGSEGVIRKIATQPFGHIVLLLLGVGLLGYAVWCVFQALFDSEHARTDGSSVIRRVGWALSGLVHAALGVSALQLMDGTSSGGKKSWLADMLQGDIGRWFVILGGIYIVGYALYQLFIVISGKFIRHLDTAQMGRREQFWLVRVGRLGISARGVVLLIVGYFLVRAGLAANANHAKDVGGALRELSTQPAGDFILLVVAVGVALYGAYSLALAKYRSIPA